jgi:hypothetical protein
MLESEKYGFHAPAPPRSAVSTVFLPKSDVAEVIIFGLEFWSKTGMPTLTLLHKFVVSVHPGLAPWLMPKFAPNIVMVTEALYGADGVGFETVLSDPLMDEITGAEYFIASETEPATSWDPQETTPDLLTPMLPNSPLGILITTELSEIQRLLPVAVWPTLVFVDMNVPMDAPRTWEYEPPVNADDKGLIPELNETRETASYEKADLNDVVKKWNDMRKGMPNAERGRLEPEGSLHTTFEYDFHTDTWQPDLW